MNHTLKTTGVSKAFGHATVLRRIDLDLQPGERIALLGRNGAGKTTLLRILATLIRPTTGSVLLAGRDIHRETEICRAMIGFISHQTFLYNDLTPIQNLRFYAQLYGLINPDLRIDNLLEMMQLSQWRGTPVRNFSRGMRQRLAIARAFLHDPPYLFLDEPFTGLDQNSSAQLAEIIRTATAKNCTVILVTHQIEQSLNLCNRVLIMEKGQILFDQLADSLSISQLKTIYQKFVPQG